MTTLRTLWSLTHCRSAMWFTTCLLLWNLMNRNPAVTRQELYGTNSRPPQVLKSMSLRMEAVLATLSYPFMKIQELRSLVSADSTVFPGVGRLLSAHRQT